MRSEDSPRVAPARSTPALTKLIDRLGATGRLAAALAIAVASYVLCPDVALWHTRVIFSWDAATIAYLCLAWTIIGFSDAKSTRAHAIAQDTSGFIIFLFVLGAACASVVAIAFVVGTIRELCRLGEGVASHPDRRRADFVLDRDPDRFRVPLRSPLLQRREAHAGTGRRARRFRATQMPDYMDFAYYSFVIGMTSQVSDVQVLSPRMRQLTLVHGVLAFIFNIAVLALSINIIASAIGL